MLEMTEENLQRVIFIRHNLRDINDRFCGEVIETLFKERKIAISFSSDILDPKRDAREPENYKDRNTGESRKKGFTSRSRVRDFIGLANTGAIVFADYDHRKYGDEAVNRESGMLLGEIIPGSEVEVEWMERIINPKDPIFKDLLPLKTIKLQKTRYLRYKDYPLLLSSKPFGRLTFGNWKVVKDSLLYIWKRDDLELTADNASPRYLELICHEYMRFMKYIDCIVERIGTSIQDVDIAGLKFEQGAVFAQITHQKDEGKTAEKIKNLRRHGARSYFFGPAKIIQDFKNRFRDVIFIATEDVVKQMTDSSLPVYKEMVDRMLNPWKYANEIPPSSAPFHKSIATYILSSLPGFLNLLFLVAMKCWHLDPNYIMQ